MSILLERMMQVALKVYLPAFVVELIFRLIVLFVPNNVVIDGIHTMWVMMSTTFLFMYSIYDLYLFMFTRKYFFLYTIKYSIQTTFFIYTSVYVVLHLMYYLLYSGFELAFIPAKLVSVCSFYLLNTLLMLWAKSMFRDKDATRIYASLLFVLIMVIPASFAGILIVSSYSDIVMVGTPFGSEMIQRLYFLIVPISVVHEQPADSLTFLTMFTNVVVSVFCLMILLFVQRKSKNW